jgi:hypothetical protein
MLLVMFAGGCGDTSKSVPRVASESEDAEEAATSPKPVKVESVAYYEKKLLDKNFKWDGPCSREDRIPVLHAARALAYIGDPVVPALLRASKNKSIDIVSVYDALDEIGLPVYEFCKDGEWCDPAPLEKWWEENRSKTAPARSKHRRRIGLPAIPTVPATSE